MRSSTSSSDRRGLWPVCLGLGTTLLLLVAWRGVIEPLVPEDPSAKEHILGKLWEPPGSLPYFAYRHPALVDLLVVGSSRIDSGIVEAALEEAGLGTATVFTGPGAQLLDLLHWTRTFEPRRLVVSLDPLSIYSETHPEIVARFEREGGLPLRRRIDQLVGREVELLQRRQ